MTAATATTKIYLALLIGMNALISSFCMDAFIRFFQAAVAALVSQFFFSHIFFHSIKMFCKVLFISYFEWRFVDVVGFSNAILLYCDCSFHGP